MTTKKQHYYPRCLLKYFANDNDKVNVYISQTNKILVNNYKDVCAYNYAYESSDSIDNILENKLGHFESKACSIVNYILKNIDPENLIINDEERYVLFQYIFLQYIRTDAGRVNFINYFENIFSHQPRNYPISLEEIKINKSKIQKFNAVFKQSDRLESFLNHMVLSPFMEFHIAISREPLLTSDNPVIITDNWSNLIFPISPHYCIQFQHSNVKKIESLFIPLTPMQTRYINQATINTANYFVISNEPFNIFHGAYLYNRFKNKNWRIGSPHLPQ
jgi:hypothetical protein